MNGTDTTSTRVVVVGNGMVGARFAADLAARDTAGACEITVLGAEEYEPYNRVLLSDVVAGRTDVAALTLPAADDARVSTRLGTEALAIDRAARRVVTADGTYPYDVVVLATGAAARVPDVAGLTDRPGGLPRGAHALRTLDDAREIVAASVNARHAVVVGAGVLGLEVACGLARRGVAVSVVHGGDSLMDRQLATAAGRVVESRLAGLGVRAWTRAVTERVEVDAHGRVRGVVLREADRLVDLDADLVVLACGTVPETGLARAAGLTVDRGVVVGDDLASPDDPCVLAVGDCAQPPEGGTGLVAQGWDQSRRLAAALAERAAGVAPSTGAGPDGDGPGRAAGGTDVVRLKASGLDVVAMGVCGTRRPADPAHRTVTLSDPVAGRHVEVVVADGLLVGATCVGAPDVGADLTAAYTRRVPVPSDPAQLLLRAVAAAPAPASTPTRMPDRTTVCTCNGVTKGEVVACWHDGARSVDDVARATRATTGCGGCREVVCGLVDWLAAADPGAAAAGPPPADDVRVVVGDVGPERARPAGERRLTRTTPPG